MTKKPKILLYSHDTFGLGHLRRTLSIAHQIARDIPQAHQLLVTGAMVAGAFELPPRLDLIKLPALSKRSSGRYKARALPCTLRQTIAWREQMLLQAAANFKPDLVLVDKVAAGVQGELWPALRYLKACAPRTRLVLGMRDIEDSPEATRREWLDNQTPQLQEQLYDAILLYGDQTLFDPVAAYGMSAAAAAKLVPCGYLRRARPTRPAAAIRRELDAADRPLIVVTVGGGGDGYAILKTYLEMLLSAARPPIPNSQFPMTNSPPPCHPVHPTPPIIVNHTVNHSHSLLITGPLMPQAQRQALRRLAGQLPVSFMEFTADLDSYLAAADLVVSMAGYNSVCEILSLGRRALLIPRGHTRAEQRIRAGLLAERGLAHLLPPEELTPERLHQAITQALNAPAPSSSINLNGLENISQALRALLRSETCSMARLHREGAKNARIP